MRVRKLWAMVIMAVMTVSSLTGCGAGKEGGGSNEGGPAASLSAEDTASLEGKYEEPITVKVGLSEDTTSTYEGEETLTDNAWFDLYKEYGIEFDVMYTTATDSSAKAEKLSQAIMGGDYPDVFWVELNDFKDYADQGVLADITYLYDEGYFSEEAMEYFEYDQGDSVRRATVDGKIYGIPQLASSSDQVPVLWIRKDWLENLGLEAPQTTEDFYAVAKAFTENDPDGNGQDDTYGFGLSGLLDDNYSGMAYFFNMFGAIPLSNAYVMTEEGITWGGLLEEEMEAGLTMLNDMYVNGYIPADFVTSDKESLSADFATGKLGMVFAPMWALLNNYHDALALNIDAEYIAVPVPSSDTNPNGAAYYPSASIGFWCASSKCENPEVLAKLWNLSIHYITNQADRTEEENEMYANGKAGEYGGSKMAIISHLGAPTENYDSWQKESAAIISGDTSKLDISQLSQYNDSVFFLENKTADKYTALSEKELETFNKGAQWYSVFGAQDSGYGALDLMIKADNWNREAYLALPTEVMIKNMANLKSLTEETLVGIIMGNAEVNSYSNEFVNIWKERGGQEMLDEVLTWYDSAN